MSEQLQINSLSETSIEEDREGNAVVLIGSFAPIHKGHFDAIYAASSALANRGIPVESLVLTPNSAEYVEKKLPDYHTTWTYERRIQEIQKQSPHPDIPTYVDNVSGVTQHEFPNLNGCVPLTVRRHLGFKANQLYLVVGSDQLLSMEAHLSDETNRAVCVLRPSNLTEVQAQLELPWIADAIQSDRFIITEREDMENDISSTKIRKSALVE